MIIWLIGWFACLLFACWMSYLYGFNRDARIKGYRLFAPSAQIVAMIGFFLLCTLLGVLANYVPQVLRIGLFGVLLIATLVSYWIGASRAKK